MGHLLWKEHLFGSCMLWQVFLLLIKLCFSPRIPFVLDRKLDRTSNNVSRVLIVSLYLLL